MDFSLFVPWIGECLSSDTSDSPVLYSCQFITRFSSFVKLNTNFVWYRWHAAGNNIDMRSACAAAVDWLEPICCANKARYLNTRLYWVRCNLCNLDRLHEMIASSFNGFLFYPCTKWVPFFLYTCNASFRLKNSLKSVFPTILKLRPFPIIS
jgi:hypothetical protein